jgi:hypothetical protein
VKRVFGWLLPLLLALAGATLIIAGQLDLDREPAPSLAPIGQPTASPVASASPTASPTADPTGTEEPTPTGEPTASPTPTPLPDDVVAVQLEMRAVGINVLVRQATDDETCRFPPADAAYILCDGRQPGRNDNSYVFAHALNTLFKPLWNVQLGDVVQVQMSDESVLTYRVTEVHPNVACPDPNPANPHLNPENYGVQLPLALQYAPDDCSQGAFWTQPTDHERLTLQTSQGFNRNWGELVIVAEPVDG